MKDRLSSTLSLDAPVTQVAGVSSGRVAALSALGITTVGDLLRHYPRRYLDMSAVQSIASAPLGENATVVAIIHEVTHKRPRRNLDIVEVTLVDDTGTMIATFFRQPWLTKTLSAGMRVSVAGKMEFNYGYKRMASPFLDRLEDDACDVVGRIIPIHGASQKIPAGQMRRIIRSALDGLGQVYDPIPLEMRSHYALMAKSEALRCIHFPSTMAEQRQARRRLAFEEVLMLQVSLLVRQKQSCGQGVGVAHRVYGPYTQALSGAVPFDLTPDQQLAISQVFDAMAAPEPMNHMILGDVGTGKTMVAAFALAAVADSDTQALMMAPTEVLARQYARSIGPLLDSAHIRWDVLTGSTSVADRKRIVAQARQGELTVIFGTHALLEPDVELPSCSLTIVDEEQRFGVDQRAALRAKGLGADYLSMTATPIPRSLAMTVYGSFTLSYLKQVPANRASRTTTVVGFRRRGQAYDAAVEACKRNEQVYVVCPLVSGADQSGPVQHAGGQQRVRGQQHLGGQQRAFGVERDEAVSYFDTMEGLDGSNLKAAQEHSAFLQAKVFGGYRVGLLHGKMPSSEKQQVMDDFREGKIQVLVCTTVIEVGVDVPNATVMIIEDAQMFGLSQLHQLRGRVARGTKPGHVFLVCATSDETAQERLELMESTDDGFVLAKADLAMRKEGDVLGSRQSGRSLLRLANMAKDEAMITAAHGEASCIADSYVSQVFSEPKSGDGTQAFGSQALLVRASLDAFAAAQKRES